MQDAQIYVTIAGASLIGIALVTAAMLRGWRDWLDLKRHELDMHHDRGDAMVPSASARIELADLKERIRKLEAIAAGVEL